MSAPSPRIAEGTPTRSVAEVRTPVRLLCGDRNAAHSPVGKAFAWYSALREQGVKTELVVCRGEGHLREREENSEDLCARSVDWFSLH